VLGVGLMEVGRGPGSESQYTKGWRRSPLRKAMHDHWHKEEDEMITNKRTLIWTWTCLAAAILLLFTVSCGADDDTAISVISVGGGTLCVDTPRFALCTSARCEIDPSDSKYAICYCDVESGANWGKTTCEERMPQDTELRSNFSPIQAGPPQYLKALVCCNKRWASCLDAPCTIDPSDPTKAKCRCSVANTRPWETLGGDCDPAECDKLWSAGFIVDKKFQEVLDAFGRLGVPGADYPYCSSE
jgi:hypothetical protein